MSIRIVDTLLRSIEVGARRKDGCGAGAIRRHKFRHCVLREIYCTRPRSIGVGRWDGNENDIVSDVGILGIGLNGMMFGKEMKDMGKRLTM